MKSFWIPSIILVALILTACSGGGGGGSRMAGIPPSEPMAGIPPSEPMAGIPPSEPMAGIPPSEPMAGIPPSEPMAGIPPSEPMEPREPEEPMEPVVVRLPPPPPVENVEARRVADALPSIPLIHTLRPFEGYVIASGVLRDRTPGVTADDPVKHTDGFINITGWQGSRHTRSIDVEEEGIGNHFDDIFVSYTLGSLAGIDYLDFGYWTRLVRINPDSPHFTANAFLFGSPMPDVNDLDLVEGSASYSGPATGLYAKKSGTLYRTSGQFKANTALQVNYGVEDTDPDAKGVLVTISGSITDFRDSNGNVIDSTWTVDLQEAQHSPLDEEGGDFDPGTTARGGEWEYLYFGVLDTNDPTVQPGAVGGLFNEEFPNGKVSGAFGAIKD